MSCWFLAGVHFGRHTLRVLITGFTDFASGMFDFGILLSGALDKPGTVKVKPVRISANAEVPLFNIMFISSSFDYGFIYTDEAILGQVI